jgi:hypothetical protein
MLLIYSPGLQYVNDNKDIVFFTEIFYFKNDQIHMFSTDGGETCTMTFVYFSRTGYFFGVGCRDPEVGIGQRQAVNHWRVLTSKFGKICMYMQGVSHGILFGWKDNSTNNMG